MASTVVVPNGTVEPLDPSHEDNPDRSQIRQKVGRVRRTLLDRPNGVCLLLHAAHIRRTYWLSQAEFQPSGNTLGPDLEAGLCTHKMHIQSPYISVSF